MVVNGRIGGNETLTYSDISYFVLVLQDEASDVKDIWEVTDSDSVHGVCRYESLRVLREHEGRAFLLVAE